MNKFSRTAGLLAAMTIPFGATLPAHATPCSGFYSAAQLTTPGFSCTIGDKEYSDFTGFGGLAGTAGFTFTTMGADHTFSGAGLNFTGSTFSYGYKVSLFLPVAGQEFKSYNTDASGSSTGTGLVYTKVLTTTSPITGPSTSSAGNPGNVVNFTAGEIGPVTFSSTLTLASGKIDNITDTLSQKIGVAETPGPLPLLGAGAAFGFSRRLRRRVKQVA